MARKFVVTALVAAGLVTACATGSKVVIDDTQTGTDAGRESGTMLPPGPDGGGGQPDSGNADSGNPDTGTPDTCMKAAPSNVCGVDPQCDCGAGTCEVDHMKLDGTTSCVTAGTSGIGKACTATANQCAQGLTCVWGVCRPYCGSVGDGAACTEAGTGICRQLQDNTMKNIPNMLVCSTDCALDSATSCGGTSACIWDTSKTVTDCYPVPSGNTCSASQPFCAPGYVCYLPTSTTYACGLWCQVAKNNCTGGKTCTGFGTKIVVGGVEYGVCI